MEIFRSQFLSGHIVVSIGKFDYLVDTGSPVSFGQGEKIRIGSKQFSIPPTMVGLTTDSINSLSGLHIHGLIGMDILRHFAVRFTLTQTRFSETPLFHSTTAIRVPIIGNVMTIPVIRLKIADAEHRFFFDTGAQLSYLSADLLSGRPSIGQTLDFHPSIGKFTTETYKVDAHLQEKTETLTFGCLPSSLATVLDLGRAKGILGSELLPKYNITLCNLSSTLVFEPATTDDFLD
jgi:hypothetical protein